LRKLTYISPDFFFDVDFPVLKNLSNHYTVIWYAILPLDSSRFLVKDLEKFCLENEITLMLQFRRYRRSDIRSILFAKKILFEIKNNSDIIYIEDLSDIYMSILSALFLKKEKVVIAFHDVVQHIGISSSFVISLAQKILIYKFDNFHLFSKTQYTFFKAKSKSVLIAPLMLKDFGPQQNMVLNNDIIKFLFFGRIEYYKGLDILINAINLLQKKGVTNFELTIAGSCKDWDTFNSMIFDISIYNLKIKFIDNKEIPNLFSEHHYLVLPYRDVTQSGPLFIAFNYEIPVLASNHEGFKEFINNGHNGYLFESDSVEDLAKTLQKIIEEHKLNYNTVKFNLKKEVNSIFKAEVIILKYLNFFNTL
jgi:glycosyltransferase involved in cell wall biosynthesis